MIRESIALDTAEVTGPARSAGAAVRALAKALGTLGSTVIDPNAASAIRTIEQAASKLTTTRSKQAAGDRAASSASREAASAAGAAALGSTRAAKGAKEQTAAERELTRAMREEATAAAKLANFDAAREKRLHALRSELRKQKALAKGKDPGDLGPALPRTLVPTLGGMATVAGGFVMAKVAAYAAQMVSSAVDLAKRGVVAALSAAAFRQDTERGLAIVLKSAGEAKKVYQQGIKLAAELGQGAQQTIQGLHGLIARGFPVDEAIQFTKALADLAIVNPSANIESLILNTSKIRSQGKVQGDELNALAEAGLNVGEFFKIAAKNTGKSVAEIQRALAAGKLTADIALPAILDSVKALTGKDLGAVAKEASGGLTALAGSFRLFGEDLLTAADLSASTKHVQDFSAEFFKLVGPGTPLGDKLVETVEDLAEAATGLLGGEKGASMLAGALETLADVGGGFAKGMKDVGPIIEAAIEAIRGITGMQDGAAAARMVGQALAYLTVAIVGLGAAAVGMYALIVQPFVDVFTQIAALSAPAQSAGDSIGKGIVRGLLAALTLGLSEVYFAATNLGKAGTDGVAAGAQTHSPSRATMKTGGYIAEGQVLGMMAGVPSVYRAALSLGAAGTAIPANSNGSAGASAPSARPLAAGVGSIGGGGGGSISVSVTLDGAASSAAAGSPEAAKEAGKAIGDGVIEAWLRRRREAA